MFKQVFGLLPDALRVFCRYDVEYHIGVIGFPD
jgi:hypothetical protein